MNIHRAAESDIPDIAFIHTEGWKAAYGGILDPDYIAAQTVETRRAQWQEWITEGEMHVLLARDEAGHAAGFISYGPLKTPPPGMSPIRPLYAAEIYAFYILPDYWRQGLGGALLRHAARAMAQNKQRSFCLWVLEKNSRAVAFYKKMGGERCGKINAEFGPTTAREICFGWRDSTPLVEGQPLSAL